MPYQLEISQGISRQDIATQNFLCTRIKIASVYKGIHIKTTKKWTANLLNLPPYRDTGRFFHGQGKEVSLSSGLD